MKFSECRLFWQCEVVDLTNEALKVHWNNEVTFWARKSDLDERSDIKDIGEKGVLWLREGWEGHEGVMQLLAEVMPGRERETA